MEEGDSGKDVATAIVPGPAAGVNHEEVLPSNGGDVNISEQHGGDGDKHRQPQHRLEQPSQHCTLRGTWHGCDRVEDWKPPTVVLTD
mgnify:CR=1 FL=1